MFLSVVTGEASPQMETEGLQYWKGLPPEKGYIRGYMVVDRKTGKWMTFNLWETEADAMAYETRGDYQKDVHEAAKLGSHNVTRQVFEVLAEK